MSLKFVTVNDVLQLLGDLIPQTPYQGSVPWPRFGTSVPRPPHLCSSEISLKNPPADLGIYCSSITSQTSKNELPETIFVCLRGKISICLFTRSKRDKSHAIFLAR